MAIITFPKGGEVVCDDSDLEMLMQYRWSCNGRYAISQTDNGLVIMHRLIVGIGDDDDRVVDHIDGNGLNNLRSNLRICTHSENMRNRKTHSNNKCGLKGVYRNYGRGRPWRAQIRVDKQKIHLGYFNTPSEAYSAYVLAAMEYHGEFARAA